MRTLVVTIIGTVLAGASHAAPPVTGPLPEEPPRLPEERIEGRFESAVNDNGFVTLRDSVRARDVITPNKRPLVQSACDHTVEIHPIDGGFNLDVVFTNNTGSTAAIGNIIIGGYRLETRLASRDFRGDSRVEYFDSHGTMPHFPPAYTYPDNLYSPVMVFGDSSYTFGVSVLYPMLEYKHSVQLALVVPGGAYKSTGFNWETHVRLKGEIEPGETRSYTVAVRLTDHPDNWLATLVPYRDYFQALYGPIEYERDPRPIRGIACAQGHLTSDQNPFGFAQPPERRPDLVGYGPFADRLVTEARNDRYNRMVLWAVSGLYREHQEWNFPPQFMSHIDEVPTLRVSADALTNMASDSLEIGYWWGNSARRADYWDAPELELIDINNPAHVQEAFAQLDSAVRRGATIIGLDAFIRMPAWDAHVWLGRMQRRYPQVTFSVEHTSADVLHHLAPTWLNAYQIETEMILADFIIPGHETWGAIQYNVIEQHLGRELTEVERVIEIRRVAEMGYTPLVFGGVALTGDVERFNAVDTRERTVPAHLRALPPEEENLAEWSDEMSSSRAPEPPSGVLSDEPTIPKNESRSSSRGPARPDSLVSGVQAVRPPVPIQTSLVKGAPAAAPNAAPSSGSAAQGASGGTPQMQTRARSHSVIRPGRTANESPSRPEVRGAPAPGVNTVRSTLGSGSNRSDHSRRTFTAEEIRAALERARRDRSAR